MLSRIDIYTNDLVSVTLLMQITMEATHHGPVTSKPTMFLEIGEFHFNLRQTFNLIKVAGWCAPHVVTLRVEGFVEISEKFT